MLDVETQQALHLHVVRSLSTSSAVCTLLQGIQVLHDLGIQEEVLVMTDGGSDFTSAAFRNVCGQVGHWTRARVSQKGGMAILERANRSLEYEFVFREECGWMQELRHGTIRFRDWYNQVRLHAASGHACPWAQLLEAAKSRNAA